MDAYKIYLVLAPVALVFLFAFYSESADKPKAKRVRRNNNRRRRKAKAKPHAKHKRGAITSFEEYERRYFPKSTPEGYTAAELTGLRPWEGPNGRLADGYELRFKGEGYD